VIVVVVIVIALAAGLAVTGWLNLRRHGESAVPAGSWEPTDEVFRDPSSGRVMRVWIDPIDGTRHYVPDSPAGSP